ncbi:TetR/AcrR family transcriptional regulator [Haloechinothrix sp. YIM 98757]|uniref:TetR/AcrR family transcriptional regulator n=1 Tax=Haloechinothrix aidingensis TaxID=2752311 RepID=A0A838AAE1_9PSEU|nr:TetR/AcrR family transcriptional regulator C-terminal domain-containing protein [Haloechinothrix aidingensis]MBA0126199.1 TetR/AcrR family transcriptional regulator [Haloechinothrix aidingensis]
MPASIEYSGGSDPDRILPMLWRNVAPASAAGPSVHAPQLSVDDVVTASIEVADSHGLGAVSLSGVAAAVGVDVTTLYTCVPSTADLLDLMVDQVLGERALPAPGEPRPDGWRAQLEDYTQRTRAMYRRHPWLRHVSMVRPPIGPGMLAGSEYVLSALASTDMTPHQLADAANAIIAFVNKVAAAEADSEQLEQSSGQTNDEWWGERSPLWERYFDANRYPTMTFVYISGGFGDSALEATPGAHDFGMRRLLDGIEAMVQRDGHGPAAG